MFSEPVSRMTKSLSMKINTQSAFWHYKSNERNMFVNFTHTTNYIETTQDKKQQHLVNLFGAKRGGICGIVGDRLVNTSNISYIDANKLCDWALMQKSPYIDFELNSTRLKIVLYTPDDSDYGCYIISDMDSVDIFKDKKCANAT